MAKHIAEIKTSAKVWDNYVQKNTQTIDEHEYPFPIDDFNNVENQLKDSSVFRNRLVSIMNYCFE